MKYLKVVSSLIGLILIAGVILVNLNGLVFAQDGYVVDHSLFPQLQVEFPNGPDVTAACLECHTEAGSDAMMTTHWTWEYTTEDGHTVGKNNVINNYCVAVDSNCPRRPSCHVGYGYSNPEAFASMGEGQVDCLVCHDSTGAYKKFPAGSGNPT